MPTERQMVAAIKAMDRARVALGPLLGDDARDSVTRLRDDLAEYAGYLESKIEARERATPRGT